MKATKKSENTVFLLDDDQEYRVVQQLQPGESFKVDIDPTDESIRRSEGQDLRDRPFDQEKPLDQQDFRPLSPVRLRERLLSIFTEYREKKLPTLLKEDKEVAAVPTKNLGWGSWFQRGLATVATATAAKTRTHAVMTTFVAEEMDRILKDRYSTALTKMTDLTILFYGLLRYMGTRKSKDLEPELRKVHIWPVSLHWIHADETNFLKTFADQIVIAADLISQNTTAADKAKNHAIRFTDNPLMQADGTPTWRYKSTPVGHDGLAPTADMGDIYFTYLTQLMPDDFTLIPEKAMESVLDSPPLPNSHEIIYANEAERNVLERLELDLDSAIQDGRRPVDGQQADEQSNVDDVDKPNSNDPNRSTVFK